MVGLGDLPGGIFASDASGVSGDGEVVVGGGRSALGPEAFIWDAANGMRSLRDVLMNDYHLDLTDWKLYSAYGISDDGLTIVGNGLGPRGHIGWIAVIPEPSTALLLAGGLVVLAGGRRRLLRPKGQLAKSPLGSVEGHPLL
jgi:hypothetical protein